MSAKVSLQGDFPEKILGRFIFVKVVHLQSHLGKAESSYIILRISLSLLRRC